MNFFERQEQSRRTTRWLVVLFVAAVLAVAAAVNAVVCFVLSLGEANRTGYSPTLGEWMTAHPGTVLLTTLAVVGIIALASLYKTVVLGGGGGVVARSLGGVRVSPDTTDPQQRRLLNVVEEMAIASGLPMPEVYLLEQETGINAFAAGHNPANAAIGVTRGTLTTLNRAELQGVIAHEFSHILNGDMRLNIRLMGLLFGLLVIALIGRTVLRLSSGGRDSKKAMPVLLVALAVMVVGYIGLFFGRLIQAAVSRSRESLADASAVQFTRDPTGLRGALVKIGAVSGGSRIGNPEVEEVAHMLFAPGMSRFFATHPALEDRLKALDPRFDPKEFERARAEMARLAEQKKADAVPKQTSAERLEGLINVPGAGASASVAALVGNPSTLHMQVARDIRKSLPDAIVIASRHPHSARVLLLALALDTNPESRDRQRQFIGQQIGAQTADDVAELLSWVDALEPEQRMPALLGAIPALRQLTRDERMQLLSTLNGMLQREGRVSLQSYVLRKLAQVHLNDDLNPAARARQLPLSAVQKDIQVLFSVLAQHGHTDAAASRRAYEAGVHHLLPRERPSFVNLAHWAQPLDLALSRLDRLAPIMKEQLVEALVKTVTHDQKLTLGEAELLRAICATVHCPLPPLVTSAIDT
ncbi:Zn-dependent protease [Steroidobacter agaridevorans]|uniref:Zn-dependent protease n=1 Tax=Steroidobacter agaridevorans TaxID=2695856 RepID=A0A829Y6X8_9GAMM|nr:M48 family metallopeptidase [Steroidobacter agaridevorans]GFE78989.1 Zn-dependent protease [Steroidobacter agaridevorans]GFE88144.1 Zn-dependent protease [Steroidobacter agaridevorans]